MTESWAVNQGSPKTTSWKLFIGHTMTEKSYKYYSPKAMLGYPYYIFLDDIGPVETSDLYGHFRNDTLKQPWLNCDACDTRIDHNMRAQWLKEPCLAIKSLSVQDVTLSSLIVVITSCDVVATASSSKDSSSRILLQRIYLQRG